MGSLRAATSVSGGPVRETNRMPAPKIQLLLARHAESAWRGAIRPWLEESCTRLTRSYVVVPTRGQAQGLKQRCVAENLPLLGVEFLSPGLARQKWLPLAGPAPVLGRELLLFELRVAIALRLAVLPEDDAQRGLLKSLQSDTERALDDFDELLKAGHDAQGFDEPLLREVFAEVAARVADLGGELGPRQSKAVAGGSVPEGKGVAHGRLLVHGLGAEAWGEFFNVAAFARCFDDVTVILPEPEFASRRALDEEWIALWERFLGVPPLPLDEPPPEQTCEAVAAWWGMSDLEATQAEGTRAPAVLAGRTRGEEMRLVADRVVRLLAGGAADIAVVFPKAGPAPALLSRLLTERGVAHADLLPRSAPPALEVRLQRALLAFHAQGGRLDELLALWPLLLAAGQTELPLLAARGVCERLFDEQLTHSLADCAASFEGRDRPEWKEVARVANLLLPVWPEELTLGEALERFSKTSAAFGQETPPGWAALAGFAERERRVLPVAEILALFDSFLPKETRAAPTVAGTGFARVVLTTRRRAEGLAWSHTIFACSNAGVWPQRQSASGWLTDERRQSLNRANPNLPAMPTADDRVWLEKRGCAALARDTSEQVLFSAALADEAEPETALAPNAWLERVLWRQERRSDDLQAEFAARVPAVRAVDEPSESVKAWLETWSGRRDPARPFDERFFSVDPAKIRPARLAARTIEAAAADPAVLWYEAVLDCERLEHGPLLRSGPRALGQLVHRVLAKALRGSRTEGDFFPRPDKTEAEARLAGELRGLRALWPADRYWDSFHAGLAHACEELLAGVLALDTGSFVATELRLPEGARISLADGTELELSGRMDLIFSDRETWAGATVDIVDFKTGGDEPLSAKRMADKGDSLQLGVYLAAARSLGVRSGRVWMVKPGGCSSLAMPELGDAIAAPLAKIARHLATGRYGSLAKDRTKYDAVQVERPLASVPVSNAILRKKYAATFGESTNGDGGSDE